MACVCGFAYVGHVLMYPEHMAMCEKVGGAFARVYLFVVVCCEFTGGNLCLIRANDLKKQMAGVERGDTHQKKKDKNNRS